MIRDLSRETGRFDHLGTHEERMARYEAILDADAVRYRRRCVRTTAEGVVLTDAEAESFRAIEWRAA